MMCEFVATVGCNPIIAEINRKADVRLRTSLGAALASLAPGASPQDRSTVVDFIITMSWGMVAGAELFPYRDHKILRHYMASLFRRELAAMRSEEHTSELQSLMRISYAVFCLKKKMKYN